jgi:AraC family transcriptional regulator of adaptative response / DNA-3-methyladenine glycosylase II
VVELTLAVREPFDGQALLDFLAARAVPGVETVAQGVYRRTLRLSHGHGVVELTPLADRVRCRLRLADLRDLGSAVERSRRLLDLDADPVAIAEQLAEDEVLRPWILKRPGLRVPGHVDGFEIAVRAVVGQQISVAGARTVLGRLVAEHGEVIDESGDVVRIFPSAEVVAGLDPEQLPMPRSRGRALVRLAAAVMDGDVVLDRGADRAQVREALLALPGIGPWTADYVALRALGDPDIFLTTDLGVRQGLARMGIDDPGRADAWRPWRSYALMHVWSTLTEESDDR